MVNDAIGHASQGDGNYDGRTRALRATHEVKHDLPKPLTIEWEGGDEDEARCHVGLHFLLSCFLLRFLGSASTQAAASFEGYGIRKKCVGKRGDGRVGRPGEFHVDQMVEIQGQMLKLPL